MGGNDDLVLGSTVRKLGSSRRLFLLGIVTTAAAAAAVIAYAIITAHAPSPRELELRPFAPFVIACAVGIGLYNAWLALRTRERLSLFHRHREYDLVIASSLAVTGPFEVSRSMEADRPLDPTEETVYQWQLQVYKRGVPVVNLVERSRTPPDDDWPDRPYEPNDAPIFEVVGEPCVMYLSERLEGAAPKPLDDSPPAKKKKKKKASAEPTA